MGWNSECLEVFKCGWKISLYKDASHGGYSSKGYYNTKNAQTKLNNVLKSVGRLYIPSFIFMISKWYKKVPQF